MSTQSLFYQNNLKGAEKFNFTGPFGKQRVAPPLVIPDGATHVMLKINTINTDTLNRDNVFNVERKFTITKSFDGPAGTCYLCTFYFVFAEPECKEVNCEN